LALHTLDLLALTLDFGLVAIDLLLLLIVGVLLALQLVADQGTGAQSESPADESTGPWMMYRCANNTAGGGPSNGPDTSSLLSGTEGTAGATGQENSPRNQT